MQRVENAAYYHAKQACYLCHQPHDVVDTEIQIEGEGVLAICRSCIGSLALTAGFDLTDRRDEIARLQGERDEAVLRANDAEQLLSQSANYAESIKRRRDEKRALAAAEG